ncbi:type I polyketide synthase [Streptomyces sp. NRRL WC-3742]|uniref:type I polyketide synthase n=1 Tax=Streptomyces sp. NRRL WC-3742 TaxID=1463934 RepID=UPI00068C1490|nr:type I polyketide synthase [Streptomyces sp. NRRL WC-3742]
MSTAISVDDYLTHSPLPAKREHYRTLGEVFDAAVETFGDTAAVVGSGQPLSWARWSAESGALACGLQRLGTGPGDVVAVQLPNSWAFLVAHVALAQLGAVLLPLHMAYGKADVAALLSRARARGLIVAAERGAALGAALDGGSPVGPGSLEWVLTVGGPGPAPQDARGGARAVGFATWEALLREYRGARPGPVVVDPELPFVVLPSSGTVSGRPKLCLHSHGALLSNAQVVVEDGRAGAGDTLVSASPFTHLFGLLSVHRAVLTGARQALLPRWDAEAFLDLAGPAGASVLFAVPAQLRDLVQRLGASGAHGRLELREVRTGGAAVPGSLVSEVRRLTGAATVVQWGMSELGAGTMTGPDDAPEVASRSIGRPLSGSSARVVDEAGRSCPVGQVGELQYRGPHLFRGYLGDPQATEAAFTPDGWLRTGDLASRHLDGTFAFHGRDVEVISVGGLKFSASTVEALLSDVPQLAAAALVPRTDARLGQYPCLVASLRSGASVDLAVVRAHLAAKGAAEYQQPLELVLVDELPLTPTGKVARGRLAALLTADMAHRSAGADRWRTRLAALPAAEQAAAALALVHEHLAELLPAHAVRPETDRQTFRVLGVDSLGAVRLALALARSSRLALATTVVFDHPTPEALARHLAAFATAHRDETPGDRPAATTAVALEAARSRATGVGDLDDPIAIVGIGCRFPGGATTPEDLWQLLVDGADTAGPFPTDRGWDLERLRHPQPSRPGRSSTHLGHFLTGAGEFDAAFFDISPREALAMDPQQRLLLETGWEALERAGLDPTTLRGSDTGVFVGQMAGDYAPRITEAPELFDGLLLTGNAASVAAGRISYTLGLNGPALTVDTACSSSLVAVHLAAQSLRRGECSLALAAGATVMASPASFVDFSRQGALAPDGRCKAFAATADGTAWGEGVAVLVLERLSRARRNGHPVRAVLAASAVNQDGASNGLTAPNGLAQQQLIRRALADARLEPGQIDVIEAHGTGTPLGDRIEAEALDAVFGPGRDPARALRLGSVKANIGHTQAAAGMAGVIKTVLALRHGQLPRTPHTHTLHPFGGNHGGALRLLPQSEPWPPSQRVRRAGVSAFGIGGTNAHVILEEAPRPQTEPLTSAACESTGSDRACGPALIGEQPTPWVLSARSAPALRELAARLVPLATGPESPGAARALATTRAAFEHRAVVIAREPAEAAAGLRSLADGTLSADAVTGLARPAGRTVFVFPGQGAQWQGMAADLLAESDVFADAMAACDEALAPHVDWSVRAVLRGAARQPGLEQVEVAQTCLFAVMVALAELWAHHGVRPHAVVGHSQGEIAAAHVCGALTLDEAARVVAQRAKAVGALSGGRMAAVALPRGELDHHLARYPGQVWLAADNGPRSTVVSGTADAVTQLVAELDRRTVRASLLAVDYASHCPAMEPAEAHLTNGLSELRPRSAEVPFYSTLTPGPLDTTALTARYWYRNLRHPVEFGATIRALLSAGCRDFIEISPHPVLTHAILETAEQTGRPATAVGTLRRGEGGLRRFLLSAAQAYTHGAPLSWPTLFAGPQAQHTDLPTYPFQRERYWLTTPSSPRRRPMDSAVQEADAPARPDEADLLALVREQAAIVLGHRDGTSIEPDEAFAALGTTSLTAVELRTRLAGLLHLSLPAAVVLDHRTPRALAAHLRSLRQDTDGRNGAPEAPGTEPLHTLDALYLHACRTGQGTVAAELIGAAAKLRPTFTAAHADDHASEVTRLAPAAARPALFCFPSLLPTSGAHEYTSLAGALRGVREVQVLAQPGVESGRLLPADLDALAGAHVAALRRHAGSGQFLLCGHSSGGLVAHAVAARLEGLGRPALGLVLLDTPWPDDTLLHRLLPRALEHTAAQALAVSGIGADRLTAAGAYLRLLAGRQPAPVTTPTLLLRAQDPTESLAGNGPTATPWQLPHTLIDVPGDHFTMLTHHAPALAEAIGSWDPAPGPGHPAATPHLRAAPRPTAAARPLPGAAQ